MHILAVYICTHIHYIERPVIEITATGGCGYVYVLWSVTDSDLDDACSISRFDVTLSSVDISMSVTPPSMMSHNFTGLPDDTLFNITVIGISLTGTTAVNLAYTSLRTKIIESMFICIHIIPRYTCVYILCKYHMHVIWRSCDQTKVS